VVPAQFHAARRLGGKKDSAAFWAVDWAAQVYVNGQEIGQHEGGFDAFTFDITPQLTSTGEQQLLAAVTDPTEGDQPRGKQFRKPEGIFYTQVSGIWQTVWLEPVPEIHIESLPDDARFGRQKVALARFTLAAWRMMCGLKPGPRPKILRQEK